MAYDFSTLSPSDFEELSRDLLQAELHARFESFAVGRDGGIDLRHARARKENWIVQCKHYLRSGWPLLIRNLRKEVAKVPKLKPSRYILTTSVSLTPSNKDEIVSLFDPWIHSPSDILGADDIRNLLALHPKVERAHFKLWLASSAILGKILNAATFARTEALRAEIEQQVKLYVSNDSFGRALDILSANHVCIIAGPPGIGKTFLARMLMLHHLQQGYDGYVVSADVDEANQLYNPIDQQFFYYDDFLGTAFDDSLAKNEDARLAELLQRVSRAPNKRVVLTTREYILRRATSRYERLHRAISDRLKCIVQLEDYTRLVRGRVLYNHLFFSQIPAPVIRTFCADKSYHEVVNHRNFSPRMIELAVRQAEERRWPQFDLRGLLTRVLEDPSTLWDHAFRNQLSEGAQTVLLAMLFLPPATPLEDLAAAAQSLTKARGRNSMSGIEFQAHLKHLDGTFISIEVPQKGSRSARYFSPAIADYLLGVIGDSPSEIESAVRSAVFFEQILALWSAGLTQDRKDGGQPAARFPQLAEWLNAQTDNLLAAIDRTWKSPSCHREQRWADGRWRLTHAASRLEARLLKVVEIGRVVKSPILDSWVEANVREVSKTWSKHDGDRAAAASLLTQFDLGAAARREVRDWSLADIEQAEDFEAAIRLRETAPDIVDQEFDEKLSESFDLFVQSQEEYILEDADDPSSAESAIDDVNSLARRLDLTPSWDEESLRERIENLGRREEQFDPEEARGAHLPASGGGSPSSETAALDSLFDSLELVSDDVAGGEAG